MLDISLLCKPCESANRQALPRTTVTKTQDAIPQFPLRPHQRPPATGLGCLTLPSSHLGQRGLGFPVSV